MKSRYIAHALFSVAVLLAIGLSSCSYVADYVEGKITNRASFSIEATYNSVTDSIIITWDETGGDNFAGFEIYMTDTPNDEYANYDMICSQWSSAISSAAYYVQKPSLGFSTTNSCTLLTGQLNLIRSTLGSGNFFFRVGIFDWDQDSDERNSDNGYTGDTYTDYLHHADLSDISGYAMVNIP